MSVKGSVSALFGSQVKLFISETPVGVHEASMKEHLTNFAMVRHGSKHKMQMHTTTTTTKIKSYAFPKQTTETTRNQRKMDH